MLIKFNSFNAPNCRRARFQVFVPVSSSSARAETICWNQPARSAAQRKIGRYRTAERNIVRLYEVHCAIKLEICLSAVPARESRKSRLIKKLPLPSFVYKFEYRRVKYLLLFCGVTVALKSSCLRESFVYNY